MSRVILCTGKKAQKPYTLRTSGVKIYTVEELCYCLYHQLDMLDESIIDREMAIFMSEELGLTERGQLLEQMVLTRADLKSRLVVIFCSSDFFTEEDLNKICDDIDELANMSAAGRKKRRADKYMADGNYHEALVEYRNIIGSKDAHTLGDPDYGNILHNIGVIEVRFGKYSSAASMFLEAYEHNGAEASLKYYFFVLKLARREKDYVREAMRLLDNSELLKQIEREVSSMSEKAEESVEFGQIDRLKVLYQQGRTFEFDRLADEIVNDLKRSYRAAAED